MIEMLGAVPKRTKTLVDRLTAARAGYLDLLQYFNSGRITNLDKLVTATNLLATAATAAQILGQVDVKSSTLGTLANQNTLLGRLPSSAPTAFGRMDANISSVSPIKKITSQFIQATASLPHGSISNMELTYFDFSLPSVNAAKTLLVNNGSWVLASSSYQAVPFRLRILSPTTARMSTLLSVSQMFAQIDIVEYN